jgi:hypothetical protein
LAAADWLTIRAAAPDHFFNFLLLFCPSKAEGGTDFLSSFRIGTAERKVLLVK